MYHTLLSDEYCDNCQPKLFIQRWWLDVSNSYDIVMFKGELLFQKILVKYSNNEMIF